MNESFVGFYWTLPVNWAGFRVLPEEVEKAAQASRTIRYQAARVRRWAQAEAVPLLDEIAFMDVRPDRGTEACAEALTRLRQRHASEVLNLVYVRFDVAMYWRANPFLHNQARELGFRLIGLEPVPLSLDGNVFDPIQHFRDWRQADANARSALRIEAEAGLAHAMKTMPEAPGRFAAIAQWLNARDIRTVRGASWTAEGVRKTISRRKPGDTVRILRPLEKSR